MNDPLNSSIPVLTEIISRGERIELESLAALDSALGIPLPVTPERISIAPNSTPASSKQFEYELVGRVLQQLLGTVDTQLETHLANSVSLVVQAASEQLISEIRASLQNTIEHAVITAVRLELDKLVFEKQNNL